jgi:cellulose biosynthesis protein BcsQ
LALDPPVSERKAVVAVASNKGGVGKTFVATNLAVYLRALHDSLGVQLIGLDDQIGIDRMFAIGDRDPDQPNLKHAFAERNLDRALQLGEYGVRYLPSPPDTGPLKSRAKDPRILLDMIERSRHPGLFLLDCKSDLEELTRAALRAADLVIVPISDQASLDEAGKVFQLLARDGGVPGRARALLTLVDRRTRVDRSGRDLHERLIDEIEAESWPRFATHISRSPRVEGLQSGSARARPVLLEGRNTAVHRQLRELAEEVTKALDLGGASPTAVPAEGARRTPRPGARRSLLGSLFGGRR